MKTTASAIVLLGFFSLLGGCSTAPAEPAPSQGPAQSSPGSLSGVPTMGAHPGDVRATTLYARPLSPLAAKLVRLSNALPPSDVVGAGLDLPETTHTDILQIAPKGTSAVSKVPVDSVEGEAYLFLGPQTDDAAAMQAALRDVVVLDPNGAPVNERVAKGPNHDSTQDLAMSAIPLAGHPVGVYTVQFRSGAPKVGLAIEARLAASTIVMKLKPSTLEHLLGNQSFVDATLSEAGAPIAGAHVVADLVDGETGLVVAPIAFTEIGGGVYRAALHSVLGAGHKVAPYLTDVRADGTSPSGAAFLRHGRTGFHFGIPSARLGGVVAQRTVTDDAGMVTALEVDVALESASRDWLEVSAKLTVAGADGKEHPVSIAHTGDAYDAGKHVVTLQFDAGQLRLTRAEGTLVVRELSLFSLGTNTLFHRDVAAGNLAFRGVVRSSLRPLPSLSPAQAQLVSDGLLTND